MARLSSPPSSAGSSPRDGAGTCLLVCVSPWTRWDADPAHLPDSPAGKMVSYP